MANMTELQLQRIGRQLGDFVEEFRQELGRSERRHWCGMYLRGLFWDGERKSIEPMSGRLEGGDEQALQQFVNQSPWDGQEVANKLLGYMVKAAHLKAAVLVLDDTSLPKKGSESVGVARQYCGALGKISNCQSVVSWQVVGDGVHFPALAQLYLPKQWVEDKARLDKAGVPFHQREFREKWKIGLELLDRIKGHVNYRALVFDAGYGEIGPLLEELEKRGEPYLAQVPRSHSYWPADIKIVTGSKPTGRPREYPAIAPTKRKPLTAAAWGQQIGQWKTIVLPHQNKTTVQAVNHRAYYRQGPQRWLLIEKLQDATAKYYVSNLPLTTSLKELVELAHQRWKVEQGYQQLKEELGLDHFEGCSWRGLNHHLVLCFMAYDFLTLLKLRYQKNDTPSLPEVRRWLNALIDLRSCPRCGCRHNRHGVIFPLHPP